MAEMTESQRYWESWFDAFTEIRDAFPKPVDVRCPDGDGGKLLVSYTGDPEERIGFAILWCDVGRNGIFLHRVGIPVGAEMLSFEATPEERATRIPPDIRMIPTDMYTADDDDGDG